MLCERCSERLSKIHKKTPVSVTLFNKVTGSNWTCTRRSENFQDVFWMSYVRIILAWNFIEKSLRQRCFPVNFVKFSRTAFSWNISGSNCTWHKKLTYGLKFYKKFCGIMFWNKLSHIVRQPLFLNYNFEQTILQKIKCKRRFIAKNQIV